MVYYDQFGNYPHRFVRTIFVSISALFQDLEMQVFHSVQFGSQNDNKNNWKTVYLEFSSSGNEKFQLFKTSVSQTSFFDSRFDD